MANRKLKSLKFPGIDDTYILDAGNVNYSDEETYEEGSVGEGLNALKEDFTETKTNDLHRHNMLNGYKQGYYAAADGSYEPNHNNYVCSINAMPVSDRGVGIYMPNLQRLNTEYGISVIYFQMYDANMDYIGSKSIGYGYFSLPLYCFADSGYTGVSFFHISISVDSGTITPNSVELLQIYEFYSNDYESIKSALLSNGSIVFSWSNFIWYYGQNYVSRTQTRIGTRDGMKAHLARTDLKVSVASGYKYAIFRFSAETISGENEVSNTGWITSDHIIRKGEYFVINMAYSNDANISPEAGANITILPYVPTFAFVDNSIDSANEYLIENLGGHDYIIPEIKGWIDGEYIKLEDGTIGTSNTYHRTDYIEINPELGAISFTNVDPASFYDTQYNAWYDESKTFISSFTTQMNGTKSIYPPPNAKYMRLSFNKTTTNTISVDYINILGTSNWGGVDAYLKSKFVTHMTHSGSGTYIPQNNRNAIVHPLYFDFPIMISVDSGYRFATQYYDGYEVGTSHLVNAGNWMSGSRNESQVIPAKTYFCMIVAYENDSNTDSTTNDKLHFSAFANLNDAYNKLMPLWDEYNRVSGPAINYFVGSDLMKRPVNVSEVGTLTYPQSFCIYNGSFYSVDGNNISVQDSTFTETDSAVLGTGHGNGLQLGNNGKAYASGWNDQKIYVVDLETLTIDDTITLPTTGYTTCVVDDVRDYAYIFQRDSYPDHEDNYNFIVYDITNSQIISTRKILAFGAMQAADLFDDRIIVLNGLGGSGCPNGYRVFDLNGNILADYFFGDFVSQEPEGVCIDRDTKEMYISMVSKKCYKVTM